MKTRTDNRCNNAKESPIKLYNNPFANTIEGGILSPISNDFAPTIYHSRAIIVWPVHGILSK
jgi:hypothetical protein